MSAGKVTSNASPSLGANMPPAMQNQAEERRRYDDMIRVLANRGVGDVSGGPSGNANVYPRQT